MADSYSNFLKDPDPQARRAELETFFGPNAAKFLKAYEEQRATYAPVPGQKVQFSLFKRTYAWPAFFIGPVWYFYRKMWAWGAGLTVLVFGLGLLPVIGNRVGLPLGIAMAGAGPFVYMTHAANRIEALRRQSPGGVIDPKQLAAAGGVSKMAAWIGGTVYVLLVLLAIFGVVMAARTGTPLPR